MEHQANLCWDINGSSLGDLLLFFAVVQCGRWNAFVVYISGNYCLFRALIFSYPVSDVASCLRWIDIDWDLFFNSVCRIDAGTWKSSSSWALFSLVLRAQKPIVKTIHATGKRQSIDAFASGYHCALFCPFCIYWKYKTKPDSGLGAPFSSPLYNGYWA